jgi:hypothetical protein
VVYSPLITGARAESTGAQGTGGVARRRDREGSGGEVEIVMGAGAGEASSRTWPSHASAAHTTIVQTTPAAPVEKLLVEIIPARRINPKRARVSGERAFPRAARAGGDLPHGAEVISQVHDASDHAVQLDGVDVAQRADGA